MLTVLIAEPAQLEVLKGWPDFAEAQTFTDAQLPAALGVVTTEQPDIVANEARTLWAQAASVDGDAMPDTTTPA